MTDLAQQFEAAAMAVKQLQRSPDNSTLLELYSLYKQATAGDVSSPPPGAFDFVGRAKYDAWTKVKGVSVEEAMKQYVALVGRLRAR